MSTEYRCPVCGHPIGEFSACPGDVGTGLRAGGVILALALGWCTECGALIPFHHSSDSLTQLVLRVSRSPKLSYLVEQIQEPKE